MRSEASPSRVTRFAVIGALVIVAACAVYFGRPSTARTPVRVPDQVDVAEIGAASFATPTEQARNRSVPVVAGINSASVTWFCGGAPASDTRLILTNRAPSPRSATIATVDTSGATHSRTVVVPGFSAMSVDAKFAGEVVAATIESRQGGLTATQRIVNANGTTVAPCTTTASSSWFFAGGDTQRGSTERLVLFNPFDSLATADVTFLTPDGFRHPQSTQGLAVPPQSVVTVDVNNVQDRRSGLGSVVTTRAGRLIAWRYQSFDGTGPKLWGGIAPKGVSLTTGLSVPLTEFALPTMVTGSGVSPRVVLANPGSTSATVQLQFALDDPATNGQPPVTNVSLIPGEVKILSGDALRNIPAGIPFSIRGRVTHGGAVAAEAWLDGAEPAKGQGAYAVSAVGVGAFSWLSPVGLSAAPIDQLGIQPTIRAVTVTVWMMSDGKLSQLRGAGLSLHLAVGSRSTLNLSAFLAKTPGAGVFVRATGPVVVSRLQTGVNAQGLVSAPALPVAGSLTSP